MIAARIFVEFGGQHAQWSAGHYLLLAQGVVQGMAVLPPEYTVLEADRSSVNPKTSVDLTITNGGGPIDDDSTAAIEEHLHRLCWADVRVRKFAEFPIHDR